MPRRGRTHPVWPHERCNDGPLEKSHALPGTVVVPLSQGRASPPHKRVRQRGAREPPGWRSQHAFQRSIVRTSLTHGQYT